MSERVLVAAVLGDRYVIEREIGASGMAIVYRADAWMRKVIP